MRKLDTVIRPVPWRCHFLSNHSGSLSKRVTRGIAPSPTPPNSQPGNFCVIKSNCYAKQISSQIR